MGIINLSPDSFYPDSRVSSVHAVLKIAESMIEEGADYLDVGAESSRPGAKPISEEEELAIILPVILQLCQSFYIPVSVDTYKPGVAQKVLEAGASIINDITGLRYPEMAPIIAEYDAGVVIMHMRGSPENMQEDLHYDDCVGEIKQFLEQGIQSAESAGIASDRIWVDPGSGSVKQLGRISKSWRIWISLLHCRNRYCWAHPASRLSGRFWIYRLPNDWKGLSLPQ